MSHTPNARLIAAAPDLLKSLETLVCHVMHYQSMPHACSDAAKDIAVALAVLRKANGEAE